MMNYNVVWPRTWQDNKGKEQTDFMRVGNASDMKNRDGIVMTLHLQPPGNGPWKLLLLPQEENSGRR